MQFRSARAVLSMPEHIKCRAALRKLRPGHGFQTTQYHDDGKHIYARHPVFPKIVRLDRKTYAVDGFFDMATQSFEPILAQVSDPQKKKRGRPKKDKPS